MGHILGSSTSALIYQACALKGQPDLQFLSFLKEAVECDGKQDMEILSGDKVPLGDNRVPLAGNCI